MKKIKIKKDELHEIGTKRSKTKDGTKRILTLKMRLMFSSVVAAIYSAFCTAWSAPMPSMKLTWLWGNKNKRPHYIVEKL
jgi:hypothetical protein